MLAAYLVFLGAVLAYLVIIALQGRPSRAELADLARLYGSAAVVELLIWPALIAYGEAAVAYAGDARRPRRLGQLGTWGVRLGEACADGP